MQFSNLEPVSTWSPARWWSTPTTPTTRSTTRQGAVAANGLVSVDSFETIEFSNKTTLTINALAGSDTINLNNPNTPTGLTGITVNGGDPTGSDTVIVNGTTGTDAVNIAPTTADAATITGLGADRQRSPRPSTWSTTAWGGNDSLTLTTPVGAGGEFRRRRANRRGQARQPAPGRGGVCSAVVLPPGNRRQCHDHKHARHPRRRAPRLAPPTFNFSDFFRVLGTGTVQTFADPSFAVPLTLPILTPGVAALALNGLDGDDVFNIPGNHPFPGFGPIAGISVDGGNPGGSDVLNFTGSGAGAVTVNFGGSTVQETGFGLVGYLGVETINAAAGAQDITVVGTDGPDSLTVTPTGANTATIAGINLVINTTNTTTLTVDSAGGSDSLTVNGTQAGETITVIAALVTVGALKPVTYANTENLRILAQAGNDTIDVTPSATTTIFVDGGDPIGSTAGDEIVLHPPGAFTIEPGPENDEGGLNAAGVQRVSWDHIEAVTVSSAARVRLHPGHQRRRRHHHHCPR